MKCNYKLIAWLSLIAVIPEASAYSQDQLQWVDWTSGEVHWGDNFSFGKYVLYAADFATLDDFQMKGSPFVRLDLFDNGTHITGLNLSLNEEYIYNDEIRITITGLVTSGPEWKGDMYDPSAAVKVERLGQPSFSPGYSVSFKDQKRFSELVKVNCTNTTTNTRERKTKWIYDEELGRNRRISYYETNPTGTACNDTYTFRSSADETLSLPPGSVITMNVSVTNSGTADAFGLLIKIMPDLPVREGQLEYYIGDLKKGEVSQEMTLHLYAPGGLYETEQHSVQVLAAGKDIKGNTSSSEAYFNFSIGKQWSLLLNKYATASLWKNNGTAYITLSAHNEGWLDLKNIRIMDTLSDKFISSDTDGNWTIDLPAGDTWNITYTVIPQETGTFTLPEMKAEFEFNGTNYTICSGRPSISVHGVDIRLIKSADIAFLERNKTSNITVTVTARNVGDVDSSVIISDLDMIKKTVLKAKESYSFSYTVPVRDETVLPPATASYSTLYGEKGTVESDRLVLKTAASVAPLMASEMNIPKPKSEKDASKEIDINYIISILFIISASVYLWIRRKP